MVPVGCDAVAQDHQTSALDFDAIGRYIVAFSLFEVHAHLVLHDVLGETYVGWDRTSSWPFSRVLATLLESAATSPHAQVLASKLERLRVSSEGTSEDRNEVAHTAMWREDRSGPYVLYRSREGSLGITLRTAERINARVQENRQRLEEARQAHLAFSKAWLELQPPGFPPPREA